MRACELLEPEYLVQMLKAVKHLSMNASLLDVLQNANSIEILVRILDEHSSGPHITVNRYFEDYRCQTNVCLRRKFRTTYSRRVITYVASIKLGRKKRHRQVSFRASNASLSLALLSDNSLYRFFVTLQARRRVVEHCFGNTMV